MGVIFLSLDLEEADLEHGVGDHLEDLLDARCAGVATDILRCLLGVLLLGQRVDVLAAEGA
jgi:hypothetical protein